MRNVLTLHFGPEQVLVNTELEFRGTLTADELDKSVDRIEGHIREACPIVTRIFVEMEAFSRKHGPGPGLTGGATASAPAR